MFGNFFIKVADVFLNIFDFFKNFNFKNLKLPKRNKTKKEINPKLFTKLNFSEVKKQKDIQNKLFNKLRKIFLKYFLGKKTIATEILMFLVLFAIAGFEIAGIYLTSIVMIYIFMLYFPKISQKHQYDDLNFELPYALRHMATELKAGKGLHDTLLTVSIANYGSLSGEFKRVLKEIKYGKSSEDALMEMSLRVSSEGLSRAVHQIVGTLRVGGNLANSLNVIAEDISFDMQIKLKEYSQKLTEEIGKGYNWYNLYRMLEYYNLLNTNKELQNLPSKLSWTHFSILIDLKDINKINYYAKLAVYENLSYRKLREKIKNNNYENKIPIKKLNNSISKEMLKNLLLQDIDNFLSLLGEDITYVKKNYLISKQEYIDVLLYSIKKNSYIVVQIKNDELNKEYLEEIKKSMHYIDKKVKTNKENKTEGIIIGKYNEKYQIIFTSNPNIIMNKTIKY